MDKNFIALLQQTLSRLQEQKLLFILKEPLVESAELLTLFNWSWSQGYTRVMAIYWHSTDSALALASYCPFPALHIIDINQAVDYFKLVLPRDFYGQPIRTPLGYDPPQVFPYRDRHGQRLISGMYYKSFHYFIEHFNASIVEVVLPAPYPDTLVFEDAIAALLSGQVDISAHCFFANFERWHTNYPIFLASQYFEVPHARARSDNYFVLAPFALSTWLMLVFYTLAMTCCYYAGNALTSAGGETGDGGDGRVVQQSSVAPNLSVIKLYLMLANGHKKNFNAAPSGSHTNNDNDFANGGTIYNGFTAIYRLHAVRYMLSALYTYMETLLQVFALLIFSPSAQRPRNPGKASLLLYLLQIVFSFCMTNLYITLLTSFLTTNIYEPQLETLEDVIASNYQLEMIEYELQYFPEDSALRQKIVFVNDSILRQHYATLNNDFMRMSSSWRHKFYAHQQLYMRTPRLKLITSVIAWDIVGGFVMPLNSPYVEVLTNVTTQAFEPGLVAKAFSDAKRDGIAAGIIRHFKDQEQMFYPLSMLYFELGWFALFAGWSLSFLLLLLEIFF